MLEIFSTSEAAQAITELISVTDAVGPNPVKDKVLHGSDLMGQLERYATDGETLAISQLLKQRESEYTLPDLELFLHFYAYSESVQAARNLSKNLEKTAQKNIDQIKIAFELSNAIKRFQAI